MRTQIITPKGTAQYPKLRSPEFFDGAEVGYTIQMAFNKEDTEKLLAKLGEELESAKNASEFKGKKWTNARLGSREDKNGDTVFKFKTKTSYTSKTGEVRQRTIPILMLKVTQSKATSVMALFVVYASLLIPITSPLLTVV